MKILQIHHFFCGKSLRKNTTAYLVIMIGIYNGFTFNDIVRIKEPCHEKTCFLYPATLKSAGYYVIPSVQKFVFECPSVRPSVRPSFGTSARQRFVSALYLEHF